MMRRTPSGTRTLSMWSPFGRFQTSTTWPTGSGSAATPASPEPSPPPGDRRGAAGRRRSRRARLLGARHVGCVGGQHAPCALQQVRRRRAGPRPCRRRGPCQRALASLPGVRGLRGWFPWSPLHNLPVPLRFPPVRSWAPRPLLTAACARASGDDRLTECEVVTTRGARGGRPPPDDDSAAAADAATDQLAGRRAAAWSSGRRRRGRARRARPHRRHVALGPPDRVQRRRRFRAAETEHPEARLPDGSLFVDDESKLWILEREDSLVVIEVAATPSSRPAGSPRHWGSGRTPAGAGRLLGPCPIAGGARPAVHRRAHARAGRDHERRRARALTRRPPTPMDGPTRRSTSSPPSSMSTTVRRTTSCGRSSPLRSRMETMLGGPPGRRPQAQLVARQGSPGLSAPSLCSTPRRDRPPARLVERLALLRAGDAPGPTVCAADAVPASRAVGPRTLRNVMLVRSTVGAWPGPPGPRGACQRFVGGPSARRRRRRPVRSRSCWRARRSGWPGGGEAEVKLVTNCLQVQRLRKDGGCPSSSPPVTRLHRKPGHGKTTAPAVGADHRRWSWSTRSPRETDERGWWRGSSARRR